jgi:hypothetical protein
MRSVPPRGSGWVFGFSIFDFRFSIFDLRLSIGFYRQTPIRNRQLTIGNQETHSLPRGGTDLIPKLTPNEAVDGRSAMRKEERKLIDLVSIGPAMLEDFEFLGVTSVSQLRRRSPERLYRELCRLRGQRIDPCCLDVFVAAVAQAKDPDLPIEQRQWWYWSKLRKAGQSTSNRGRKSARAVTA